MDQLQGNHVDLTSHIKEGKEQQHVIQTQVLELASNVTEMNHTLTSVVNDVAVAEHTVAQLDKAIDLTAKQEMAVMYAELLKVILMKSKAFCNNLCVSNRLQTYLC
jgi:septal ring factor EnvC (AmiA/AmiB activator)